MILMVLEERNAAIPKLAVEGALQWLVAVILCNQICTSRGHGDCDLIRQLSPPGETQRQFVV